MKLSIIGSSVFAGLAASQSCNPLADASSSVNAVSGYANIPSQYTVIQPDPSGNPAGLPSSSGLHPASPVFHPTCT
ncbi:hypothetical protein BC830DRAFT_1175142 [Chytriomyces sp. MP71]|nr:hypothetical protein BC830DRAFT_1175142 [Chytriomyces sp. MP71]